MKKILALLLSLILTVSFAGCDNKKNAKSKEGDYGFNAEGYPIVSQQIALTAVAKKHPIHGEWENTYWAEWAKEKSGIDVKFDYVDNQAWEQRKQLLFASGDLPDLIIGGGAFTRNDISLYGENKFLKPMNKLIDNYAPDIVRAFNDFPAFKRSVTSPDGNVYSLGKLMWSVAEGFRRVWINQEWLKNLGMENPTTVEEMRKVLYAFRDKDPDGNGKNDTIAASGVFQNWEGDTRFVWLRAFGILVDDIYIKNGKVVYGPALPEFKDYLTEMNYLVSNGLLDKAYFTQSASEFKAIASTGKVGLSGFSHPSVSGGMDLKLGEQYFGVKPLSSNVSHKGIWDIPGNSPDVIGSYAVGGFVITDKNKYPEASIRWANMWYTEEGGIVQNIGPKKGAFKRFPNTGWVLDKNDEYTFDAGDPGYISGWEDLNKWIMPASDGANFGRQPELFSKKKGTKEESLYKIGEMLQPYGQNALDIGINSIPGMYLSQEDSEKIALINAEIKAYVQQNEAKFITGVQPISNFDNYINTLKGYNLDTLIGIYQKYYDEYIKK